MALYCSANAHVDNNNKMKKIDKYKGSPSIKVNVPVLVNSGF